MAVFPHGRWTRNSTHDAGGRHWLRWLDNESVQDNIEVNVGHGDSGDPYIEIECGNDKMRITNVPAYLAEQREAILVKEEPAVLLAVPMAQLPPLILLELREDGSLTWKGTI